MNNYVTSEYFEPPPEWPGWVPLMESRRVERWFYNDKDLRKTVMGHVQIFAKFVGEPTRENLLKSLEWKTMARFMTEYQANYYIQEWDICAEKLKKTPMPKDENNEPKGFFD